MAVAAIAGRLRGRWAVFPFYPYCASFVAHRGAFKNIYICAFFVGQWPRPPRSSRQGLWVSILEGACYWCGVGGFMFNSPSSYPFFAGHLAIGLRAYPPDERYVELCVVANAGTAASRDRLRHPGPWCAPGFALHGAVVRAIRTTRNTGSCVVAGYGAFVLVHERKKG